MRKIISLKNKNEIYVCHFPGRGEDNQAQIRSFLGDKKFEIDSDISLISVMDKNCYKTCDLVKQFPNLIYSEQAYNATSWDMTKKIDYILECLYKINTKYALITDGRDVLVSNNIDKDFINKFEATGYNILYNASNSLFPKKYIENDKYIVGGEDEYVYLNAGVCFGYRDKLIEWYEHCKKVNAMYPSNIDEQFVIRMALNPIYKIGIDGGRNFFYCMHSKEVYIEEENSDLYISAQDPFITLDSDTHTHELTYNFVTPLGKRISGKYDVHDTEQIGYASPERNIIYLVNKKTVVKDVDKLSRTTLLCDSVEKAKKQTLTLIFNRKANKMTEEDFKSLDKILFGNTRRINIFILKDFTNIAEIYKWIVGLRSNLKYIDLSDMFINYELLQTKEMLEFINNCARLENVQVTFTENLSYYSLHNEFTSVYFYKGKIRGLYFLIGLEKRFKVLLTHTEVQSFLKKNNFKCVQKNMNISLYGNKLKLACKELKGEPTTEKIFKLEDLGCKFDCKQCQAHSFVTQEYYDNVVKGKRF